MERVGLAIDEPTAKVDQGVEDDGAKVLQVEDGGIADLGACSREKKVSTLNRKVEGEGKGESQYQDP